MCEDRRWFVKIGRACVTKYRNLSRNSLDMSWNKYQTDNNLIYLLLTVLKIHCKRVSFWIFQSIKFKHCAVIKRTCLTVLEKQIQNHKIVYKKCVVKRQNPHRQKTKPPHNCILMSLFLMISAIYPKVSLYGRFLPKLPPCVRIRIMIYLRNCVYSLLVSLMNISSAQMSCVKQMVIINHSLFIISNVDKLVY